jgi:integrase
MPNRKTLSDRGVAALKPRAARYALPDPELRGHYVRVQPSGAKTFVTVARSPEGQQVWTMIDRCDVLSIEEARERARDVIKRVRAGLPAFAAPPVKPDTCAAVAGDWVKRHVAKNGLLSRDAIERLLRQHILPAWHDREFISIRRGDVARLLDQVEDAHGARQADYVLAIVRGITNWYAARHEDYASPIVRGMRRQNPKARQRSRILADNEMAAVWRAGESNGRFGAIIRLALLTAQRREKLASMQWDHVSLDGTWTVPADVREKGTGGELVLPAAAVEIIRAQLRLGDNPYVFGGRGNTHFRGYSKAKRAFDAKLPPMERWTLHDLRRSARSLLSRASVRPDIAERVMGHAIAGVEGTYDRHSYRDEKADALKRLAALIDGVVNPRENVVPIPKRRKRR